MLGLTLYGSNILAISYLLPHAPKKMAYFGCIGPIPMGWEVYGGLRLDQAGLHPISRSISDVVFLSRLPHPGRRTRSRKKRFTEAQIAFALRQAASGTPVAEITRKMGVSDVTFYRWKKQFA